MRLAARTLLLLMEDTYAQHCGILNISQVQKVLITCSYTSYKTNVDLRVNIITANLKFK
jgi:uncharacterized protein YunC (DUF1805 family)